MTAQDKATAAEANKLQAKNNTANSYGTQQAEKKIDWRKGNFTDPSEPTIAEEQAQHELEKKQHQQNSQFGLNVTSVTYDDPNKKLGKHAKRRANKKAKQAEAQDTTNAETDSNQ